MYPNNQREISRIRNKTNGLYWNDARWAKLEGTFHEVSVTPLDDEHELVKLREHVVPPTVTTRPMWNDHAAAGYKADNKPYNPATFGDPVYGAGHGSVIEVEAEFTTAGGGRVRAKWDGKKDWVVVEVAEK